MDEALRRIQAALMERRTASRIDDLLPDQPAQAQGQGQAGGLGIEHYGKVSMVAETPVQASEPARAEQTKPYQDAGARIAAGSKELSLDELSEQEPPKGDMLKTQHLGGSRFHEINLDDLAPPAEDGGGNQG